jgi:[protein-PII] uridylyltransferase
VEDFFQLTNRHDAPLDAAQQDRLLHALLERIGPARD